MWSNPEPQTQKASKQTAHQRFDCVQGLEQSDQLLAFPVVGQQTQTGYGEAGPRMLQLPAQPRRRCIVAGVLLYVHRNHRAH